MKRYKVRDNDETVAVFRTLIKAIKWGQEHCQGEFYIDRVERETVYLSEGDEVKSILDYAGCAPDITGGMTIQEYIDWMRGKEAQDDQR